MPLDPQAEAILKKLADSGAQPFETMTLAESQPELTAPGPSTVLQQTNDGSFSPHDLASVQLRYRSKGGQNLRGGCLWGFIGLFLIAIPNHHMHCSLAVKARSYQRILDRNAASDEPLEALRSGQVQRVAVKLQPDLSLQFLAQSCSRQRAIGTTTFICHRLKPSL